MVCSKININKSMLSSMIAVSFVIIVGAVEMDHFLDKTSTKPHILGIGMSILGYVLFSVLASINQTTHKFDMKWFVKRGLPVLVVGGSAIISQRMNAHPSFGASVGGLIISLSSWGLLASMLVFSNPMHRRERLWLYYGGAILINVSMIALFMNRKYNSLTGKWDGQQNVFGMGLPMLTMGWLSISAGMSLC